MVSHGCKVVQDFVHPKSGRTYNKPIPLPDTNISLGKKEKKETEIRLSQREPLEPLSRGNRKTQRGVDSADLRQICGAKGLRPKGFFYSPHMSVYPLCQLSTIKNCKFL